MPCITGVPQGSVISPTLFNVHIDDLDSSVPTQLNVNTCKYADDCTQHETIQQRETSHMQEVLNAMCDWAANNKMMINEKKTKDMCLPLQFCIE